MDFTFIVKLNFPAFLSSGDFLSKSTFSKNSFRNVIRVSNSMDSVGPDLGPDFAKVISSQHKEIKS